MTEKSCQPSSVGTISWLASSTEAAASPRSTETVRLAEPTALPRESSSATFSRKGSPTTAWLGTVARIAWTTGEGDCSYCDDCGFEMPDRAVQVIFGKARSGISKPQSSQ